MAFVSFACGVAVSAGTFAFILVIGVVPRMIRKMNLADKVICFENMIVLGVLIYLLVRPYRESSDLEVKYSAK